ncbi:hypothetical protein ACOSQ3_001012 [Xanthoceras sorbifolium]
MHFPPSFSLFLSRAHTSERHLSPKQSHFGLILSLSLSLDVMLLLITSALNIKRTVNLFAELFTEGTFNFMPAVGRVVLHATSYNGNFQGAAELDAQSIGGYTASGSSECSYRVNLEHFRNILNLLSDDEPISIQGTDLELKVTGGGDLS